MIVVVCSVILLIGYFTYGKFLSNKVFQLDDSRKTPSVEMDDGVDYVPADAKYLAGQHFSAIAAAGPIVGPIVAGTLFGWVPALIWVLVGSIFIGGVHDMGALIASVRHKARSITEVVRENVSQRAFILFMVFIWITLVYIIVAFTDITARSFVGVITLEDGTKLAGGALATSSIIYIILPIIMGLLLKFTRMNLWVATAIFLPLVGVAIWIGPYIPLSLDTMLAMTPNDASKIWAALILVYCLVCAVLPMWMLLQPRGHLGGFFLYASLAAASIGVIFGGFEVKYPAFVKNFDDMGAFFFPCFPSSLSPWPVAPAPASIPWSVREPRASSLKRRAMRNQSATA
jgi:carbon starvation protein